MTLGWQARRRWSLLILLVGMPLYVVAAVSRLARFDRPGLLAELAIYVGLGILWALPFRFVFRGVARPDPAGPSKDAGASPSRSNPSAARALSPCGAADSPESPERERHR